MSGNVVYRLGCSTLLVSLLGCQGQTGKGPPGDDGDEGSDDVALPKPEDRTEDHLPADPFAEQWRPVAPCAPVMPKRVTRLSDRHLSNAIQDLLALERAPNIQTTSGSKEDFMPNQAAALDGAVFGKLASLAESLAKTATASGSEFIKCSGDGAACARSFMDKFAARAFRRPLNSAEAEKLMAVYQAGAANGVGHAGGIALVIEAVLQSPSFVYQTELGDPSAAQGKLTGFELAAKLGFFLRDSLPDDELWQAAVNGDLDSAQGVANQVDRLMATPTVKANVSRIYQRLFHLDRVLGVRKDPSFTEFTPDLTQSMYDEAVRTIERVLHNQGNVEELLTSRKTSVDARLAKIYGVPAPQGTGLAEVELPASQRAGILTHAAFNTLEATPNDSSVVHRGVFLARELLCFFPPPPGADDLELGEELKKDTHTERERAEKRLEYPRCAQCHSFFDPLGVPFEHYDTMGRYRESIATPNGDVAVNANWKAEIYDIRGEIPNAIDLSQRLGRSGAVRECLVRQFASYALGQRLGDIDACTIGKVAEKFTQSQGNLVELVREVAKWPALADRMGGTL